MNKLFDNVINALDTLGGSHSMFLYAQLSLSVALSMFNKYHVNLDMSHSYIACSHEIVYYAIINIFTYLSGKIDLIISSEHFLLKYIVSYLL